MNKNRVLNINTSSGSAVDRVKIALIIDVDLRTWARSNGAIVDAAGDVRVEDARDDIRSYVLNLVQGGMIDETDAVVTMAPR
jgi:hypothetical protein